MIGKRTIRHWLMKTEPDSFSIDDLQRDGHTWWSGVRNYQARNFMRDDMKVGDQVLFYHSSTETPGVAGIARISGAGRVEEGTWVEVDVAFVEKFPKLVTLETMRKTTALKDMLLLHRGQRLSIQPVSASHFNQVCRMGRMPAG